MKRILFYCFLSLFFIGCYKPLKLSEHKTENISELKNEHEKIINKLQDIDLTLNNKSVKQEQSLEIINNDILKYEPQIQKEKPCKKQQNRITQEQRSIFDLPDPIDVE